MSFQDMKKQLEAMRFRVRIDRCQDGPYRIYLEGDPPPAKSEIDQIMRIVCTDEWDSCSIYWYCGGTE